MGNTNSDIMEEIMVLCYMEGIVDEVRNEVSIIMESNKNISPCDAYEMAYRRISKTGG
jgi:hypothetical protein